MATCAQSTVHCCECTLFFADPDPAFHFDVELDSAIHFDTDPDPFCFKEAM